MNKKTSTVFAILMIALTLVGVTYACWNKTLTINGDVNTGKVDVIITSVGTDDEPGHVPHALPPGAHTGNDPGYIKDVASCVATLDIQTDPSGETLKINITNGYPCYHCSVHFTVTNIGTVPVKYNGSEITGAPACIYLEPSDSEGEQLDTYNDPPNKIYDHRDYTIYIHILQSASQDTDYVFYIKFLFVQWNEYPYIP